MTENGMVMYGTSWCGDCRRAKKVLERRSVDYAWVDVEKMKGAREEMLRLNGGDRRVPTLLHTYSLCPRHPRSPATAGTSRRFLALSLAAGSGLWHLSGPAGDLANHPATPARSGARQFPCRGARRCHIRGRRLVFWGVGNPRSRSL